MLSRSRLPVLLLSLLLLLAGLPAFRAAPDCTATGACNPAECCCVATGERCACNDDERRPDAPPESGRTLAQVWQLGEPMPMVGLAVLPPIEHAPREVPQPREAVQGRRSQELTTVWRL